MKAEVLEQKTLGEAIQKARALGAHDALHRPTLNNPFRIKEATQKETICRREWDYMYTRVCATIRQAQHLENQNDLGPKGR